LVIAYIFRRFQREKTADCVQLTKTGGVRGGLTDGF
jgi:hypothetical protein